MAKFLKFIVNTILIAAIVVAASLLIPPLAGVTTLIIDDIEMETNLDAGSVTYALEVNTDELSEGDKVLLYEDEGENVYYVSSVNGSEFTLEDRLSTDGSISQKELQGLVNKVVLTVPFLGYVSMALRTMEGLIIVGLSVVFVIILFILAEIWRKEEEDEELDGEEEDEEVDDDAEPAPNPAPALNSEPEVASDEEEVGQPETIQQEDECPEEPKENNPDDVNDAKMYEPSKEEQELFEETSNFFAADIAQMMGLETVKNEEEQEEVSEMVAEKDESEIRTEEVSVLEEEAEKEKVLAMPGYTVDELLEKAKVAGDEPELVVDEISGVTFLDYSDIL